MPGGDGFEAVDLRADTQARLTSAYELHHRSLVAMCRRRLGNVAAAEDAAQEAFLRALSAPGEVTAFVAWLYTVAANICTDELRRRARRSAAVGDVGGDVPAAPDERALDIMQLRDVLGRLPRKEREVLAARALDDLPYSVIAERMRISESAVGVALHRARRHAAAILAADVEGSPSPAVS